MSNTSFSDFENLIMMAHSRGASDLHLIPGEPPVIRIDGVLERTDNAPLTANQTKAIASVIVPEADSEKIAQGEVIKSITVGEIAARAGIGLVSGEITISARLIPTSVPSADMLGLPEGLLKAAESPKGLIIISGRVGSGKSTIAYSLIDYINTNMNKNIHTFEEPIMYRLTPKKSLVQQREMGIDMPTTVSGLKQSLYMDPDVIFLSGVKTLDDIGTSLTIAENGHLVIMIMHADSPESAIKRISDVFPEQTRVFNRKILASVLRCVASPRLLPKTTGGRVAAFGVLVPDDEMRTAIAEGGDLLSRRNPLPDGCLIMRDEIKRMADEGIITAETAENYLADC